MKGLSLSKKNKKKSSENSDEDKENKSPEKSQESSEEEVIDTNTPRDARRKRNKRAKKLKHSFLNSEKEKYLSRLANVADLISSSSSEPDSDDEDFNLGEIEPESDSGTSDNSSLVNSSQVESLATPSKQSYSSEDIAVDSNNKKVLSSLADYSSNYKKRSDQ